jgi:hypothetical protein
MLEVVKGCLCFCCPSEFVCLPQQLIKR